MQQNPVTFSLLLVCGLPLAIFFLGFWVGRGGPLPGGRHFVFGVRGPDHYETGYDDK